MHKDDLYFKRDKKIFGICCLLNSVTICCLRKETNLSSNLLYNKFTWHINQQGKKQWRVKRIKHKLHVKINSHKHENEVKLSTANLESFRPRLRFYWNHFRSKSLIKPLTKSFCGHRIMQIHSFKSILPWIFQLNQLMLGRRAFKCGLLLRERSTFSQKW